MSAIGPTPAGFIGVVHLPAMPGDPRGTLGDFDTVRRTAMSDAAALVEGGVDGLIIENFGSVPFAKRVEPHQVAVMTLTARTCVERFDVPVGINCLRNDARAALGIAAATGAAFIRVNVHTGAYVTDQGLIEGDAAGTLRYRQRLGAQVKILADVLVKHATPVAPLTARDAAADALSRGLADGLIVTGAATGAPTDADGLREVRAVAGDVPVLVGSGVTPEWLAELDQPIDGAIVGTWLKRDGVVQNPVDGGRVEVLAKALKRLNR